MVVGQPSEPVFACTAKEAVTKWQCEGRKARLQ